jgi:hypothetical protein
VAWEGDFTGGGRAWAGGNGGHWNSNTRRLKSCCRATSGGGSSWEGVLAVGNGDLVLVAGGGSNRPAGGAMLTQFVSSIGRKRAGEWEGEGVRENKRGKKKEKEKNNSWRWLNKIYGSWYSV